MSIREDTEDIELCNENDPSDPDFAPPEQWGQWADRDTYELGPAYTLLTPVPTTPWQRWLAGAGEVTP